MPYSSKTSEQMDFWNGERNRYLALYKVCDETDQLQVHSLIVQCEAVVAALHSMYNLSHILSQRSRTLARAINGS